MHGPTILAIIAGGVNAAPDHDPLIGETIAGYRITALIGEGGMGRVYQAVLPSINALVAIKVLSVEVASEPDIAERFIAEAKIANLVRHDGLVNVIGIGVVPDGRPYQIMELLHGATLAELIRERGRLPLGTACVVLCEALRALAALHAGGVVHRDVKSSNLFVTTAGHVKVIDFGIAKLVAAHGITQSGQTLGTPEYMAPEQLEGGSIDERADVYSLGVVLFECATGDRPFKGRVLEAIAAKSRPPLSGGPPGLDEVIGKAMDPDRSQRYADALDMESALQAFAQTLPEEAFTPLADGPVLPRPTNLPTRNDLPAREAPTRPSVQQMLGRYEVHGVIGKGAAGVVMEGFDPLIQRRVALKVLHPNKSHRDRLIREAQAMAKVADPNIVTLYELGDDGSRMFLAMELVDGTDLATWLHESRPWRDIVRVFVAAGRGLDAAHAGGIVHRDFKPANVLIGRDGRPRVGDFGLALGHGGGTPAYMAPEQVDGIADARSDQFSFCASLWEALHGELPFAGTSVVSLAISARAGTIRTPVRATLVDDVLRRGLAARPADRHDSMTQLLALLERAMAPRPRRWPWFAAAGLVATAAAATITVAWLRHDGPPDLNLLREARAARDPASVLRALGHVPDAVLATPEARQLAADAAVAGPTRDITASSTITGIEVSPDGRRVAIASRDEIAVHDLGSDNPPIVLHVAGSPSQMNLDADAIIARIDDAIFEVPLDGSPQKLRARCGRDDSFMMTGQQMLVSPDMRFLACSELTGSRVVDTRTGQVIHTHGFVFEFAGGVDRVVIEDNGMLNVIASATGAILGSRPVGSHAMTATNGDLVVTGEGKKLTIWNVVEGIDKQVDTPIEIKQLMVSRGPAPQIAAMGPDGKIDLFTAAGVRIGHFEISGQVVQSDVPVDHARNRFVFLTDGTASVNDLDSDRRVTLATHAKGFAISNDASTIVLAQGTTATVWYPDLRLPAHRVMPADAVVTHATNADGTLLWYVDAGIVRAVDLVTGKSEDAPAIMTATWISLAPDDTIAILDEANHLWWWRRGGPVNLVGQVHFKVRWFVLVDDDHAAVVDTDNHLHFVAASTDASPCGAKQVLAMSGSRAIVAGDASTSVCELRTGTLRKLTSSSAKLATMAVEGGRVLVIDNGRARMFRMADAVEEPLPVTADIVMAHVDSAGRRAMVVDRLGDAFVLDRTSTHTVPLADSHGAMVTRMSPDGARVAAVVDGHVRMWFVDRPSEPHDVGQLGPLPPAAISLTIGRDAVLTTSGAFALSGSLTFVLDSWPMTLPDVDQVHRWIRAVSP